MSEEQTMGERRAGARRKAKEAAPDRTASRPGSQQVGEPKMLCLSQPDFDGVASRDGSQSDAPEGGVTREAVLDNLERGAKHCEEVQRQLALYITPELDTIMRLHRLVILKLSAQADIKPELWEVVKDLMKPVMDWARLQEQRREQELAERKYHDQVEAQKAEQAKKDKSAPGALTPETLEKIELELKLL